MKRSSARSTVLATGMAVAMPLASLSLMAAPAALAQNTTQGTTQGATQGTTQGTAIPAQDFANCKQALSNLNVVEIMEFGALQAIAENPTVQAMSEADRAHLNTLLREEIAARRDSIITAIAAKNCSGFTSEQLSVMLRLSQIKALNDAMWHGADPSRPAADFSQLNAEELALVESVGNETWFGRFLTEMDMSEAEQLLSEGIVAALERFQAP